MTKRETRVIKKAVAWWKKQRPSSWNEGDHFNIPAINTATESEKRLALAVADYLKNKKG